MLKSHTSMAMGATILCQVVCICDIRDKADMDGRSIHDNIHLHFSALHAQRASQYGCT